MKLLSILLQCTPVAEGAGGGKDSGMMGMLFMVSLIAVFYFFMIRPQQKKQKEIKKMRESMKVGDKVVTAGGIYGKIKDVNDTAFIIEIAENVRIKVDKASVFATADDISKTQQ